MLDQRTAVVVLSGGQDSMTCLAMARATFQNVLALSFDYGQRHATELECAAEICRRWNIPHTISKVDALRQLVSSALIASQGGEVTGAHSRLRNLPASFVPARNALFLTLAHAFACEAGASLVYTGVCQTDYSGYPDCRDEFVRALNNALNIGYEASVYISTPLMFKNKAETFALADRLGVLAEIIEHSHTCYNGDREHRHLWGYGCGKCPACNLRAAGYDEFMRKSMGGEG